MSAPRQDVLTPHGRTAIVHAPVGADGRAPCGVIPSLATSEALSRLHQLTGLGPPLAAMACIACQHALGFRPGARVRAPRNADPETYREVGAQFGATRHRVVQWYDADLGREVRSSTVCGLLATDLRTTEEWAVAFGGGLRAAPKIATRRMCRSCLVRPSGRRSCPAPASQAESAA